MKIYTALIGMLMICVMVGAVSGAPQTSSTSTSSSSSGTSSVSAATTTLSSEQALSTVYVSSVAVDPQEFFPFEQGTITVTVVNSGPQEVAFKSADILDSPNVYIPDERTNPYQTMMYMGPGTTQTYTFDIVAKPPEGIYYPVFSLASRDAGSIYYPIQVRIDSTPIKEAISQAPQNFAINETDNVTLEITNPRVGYINNTVITASAPGVSINPSQVFINSIAGGNDVDVPFAITPHQAANVTFTINYNNGVMNPHSDTVVLPLNIGKGINEANPVINDLALTVSGGAYQLTGDVTNEGIVDANGVLLTVEPPAQPAQPYAELCGRFPHIQRLFQFHPYVYRIGSVSGPDTNPVGGRQR